ncbi:Triose-phosphate Transporter [Podila epicladia]|nr:Triose-phosphate Transporter [Podila epicladia]KAG0095438.1 Triose-phosphate Transporter [Podila epicladia]
MTESPQDPPPGSLKHQDTATASLIQDHPDEANHNPFEDNLADSPHLHRVGGRGHNRADSVASSHSSNDGIEWETSRGGHSHGGGVHGRYEDSFESDRGNGYHGHDVYENDSDYSSGSDGDSDEDDEDEDELEEGDEDDTQRLLISSRNTRMGGMGMGMRAGETGTGTTIGLDLEQRFLIYNSRTKQRGNTDDDYDALPLTTVDEGGRKGRKGSKRKRSNRRGGLDGRGGVSVIAPGTEMDALAKRHLRVQMLWNIFYVFAWYSCSTSLSFYNKWLFSPAHYNFRFPLFTTCLHMVAQFLLSSLTLTLLPRLRPKAAPTPKDFGTKIMPCAVASGLDIGLSNSSLKTITLAFYTMCKSSSLAFVLLFAFLFKLERPTWTLAGVIGVICIGLFMMVMSEVDFVLIGFIQVMMASVLGGLRWSLTQLLLEKSDTKSGSLANPISTIFFLSPIMGICLCVVAGIFEGFGTIFSSEFFHSTGSAIATLGLLFLGGAIAFAMVLAEFNLIARTSVVSLSVLGIIKEVMTIVISAIVFHDHLTIVNILGLFVTLAGIGFYHFMKLREMKARARIAAKEIADLELSKVVQRNERALERKTARENRRKSRQQIGGSLSKQGDETGETNGQATTKQSAPQNAFILDEDEIAR